jgi:PAS domain S-box-containing protein
MFETRLPVCRPDTANQDSWISVPDMEWIRSHIGAPILRGDQMIGVLNIDSMTPGFFTPDQAQRVQAFADQVAIAIQNARLYTAEHDQRTLAQALSDTAAAVNSTLNFGEVLDRILANVGQVLPHDAANIMLIEEGRVRIVGSRGYVERGLGQWIRELNYPLEKLPSLQQINRTGQPVVLPDIRRYPDWAIGREQAWIQSFASAPIRQEGAVIGFLNLYSETPGFFVPAQARRLQAFADQVSIAMQNARLYAAAQDDALKLQAQAERLALINRVASQLAQTLDLHQIYDIVLRESQRALNADYGGLAIFEDDEIGRLVSDTHPATSAETDVLIPLRNNRSIEYIERTHKPLVSEDVQRDPLFEPTWELLKQRGTASLIIVPLVVEGRVIGTLGLDSTTVRPFTSAEMELVETIASQASLAISKAQLFAAEREQRTLAEALRDTAAAVNRTLDLEQVMDSLLGNVGRVAPHEAAFILLIEGDYARVARFYYPALDDMAAFAQSPAIREGLNIHSTPNIRRMLETGGIEVISDTQLYPEWKEISPTEWIRSQIAAPIRQADTIIGFLVLASREPGFYAAAHAARLHVFADQASVAIQNARLYHAVQHHASEMEQRVRERTAELEAQRAQLQTILDAMGEGVVYAVGHDVIYVNGAFSSILGYEGGEIKQNAVAAYRQMMGGIQNHDQLIENMMRHFERSLSWRSALKLRRQNGEEFDAALTVTQVSGTSGAQRGVVSILRDISQEKALQAQKDRFIANASHELRTPVANLKTRLYLVRRQPERLELHLDVMERVADSMTDLIENLLDISRFERGVIPLYPRTVLLQDLVGGVAGIQQPEAERKGVVLTCVMPDSPLQVSGDPQRLGQVITNLVTNAINYTPEGGTIRIELDRAEEEGRPRAVIRVRDTGIGISPEALKHVFEPFFRASDVTASGTGLGLTIAREIVHMHRGDMEVESEVGRGSVFTVKLDLVK